MDSRSIALLGFIATDFMITITLSASDAAVHLAENPLVPGSLRDEEILITLLLMTILGVVLNPQSIADWQNELFSSYGSPLAMVGVALLVFPRLALGISEFETGVTVMPLVRGESGDDPKHPAGRIRNTRKLLTSAGLIMSFYLITTSFILVVLIPSKEFQPGGAANGRALAYLAHQYLGDAFGTLYDLSTIAILAFAGASAVAGLLNVSPATCHATAWHQSVEFVGAVSPQKHSEAQDRA